jgi:tRNA A-37 threonylcarbamoyl transferase component Bud32
MWSGSGPSRIRPAWHIDVAPANLQHAAVISSPSDTSSTENPESVLISSPAIRREQAVRSDAMVRLVFVAALLTTILLSIAGSHTQYRWLAVFSLALVVIASAPLAFARKRQSGKRLRALGVVACLATFAVMLHVGVHSPVVMALIVGVYFVGLGDSPAYRWALFSLATLGYLVLGLLAAFGWFGLDDALFEPLHHDVTLMSAVTVLTCSFLGLTFWLARRSRGATLDAMAALELAQRQIRQRDALLHEAHADLNRALDVARVGRYTKQQVGPYLLSEVIGRGAMAEIYRGRDSTTEAQVAVKLLHHHVLLDPEQVERFHREAELCKKLDSPHIVKVLDAGEASDGSPYVAFEHLAGHDLAWLLRENRRLDVEEALTLVLHVAQALTVAHRLGIVHRDLKPQNLFLCETERGPLWKVLDFGACKIDQPSSSLTLGSAVGTPSYMAPEQARGEDVDHRTAADSMTTMYNVVHMQPVRPSELRPMPRDVDRALALALAKDRERRFPTANALAVALTSAFAERLSPELRVKALELIREHPWGRDDTEPNRETALRGALV